MSLSSDLVSAFAKITNDEPSTSPEGSTAYGRYVVQGESAYVQLDGSDVLTPVATTAEAKNGDRVTIMIKNHKAVVTGNLSDPSASGGRVTALGEKLTADMEDVVAEILESISNSLLSAEGGYMQLVDQNGAVMTDLSDTSVLSGFRIMDTPTVTETTKGWLANKNGIGWSDDGFKTISKVGLDMANGRIYADEIAAGSMITNSFQIGNSMFFNGITGEITFGSNVTMGWGSIEDAPDIPDAGTITYITQNAIQTGDLHLGGSIYRMVGDYWWNSTEHLLFGVNGYNNLQVGSPSSAASYDNTNIYAKENIYLVPGGERVDSGNWTMIVRGASSATGQGVSIHGNLSADGTIYQNGSPVLTSSALDGLNFASADHDHSDEYIYPRLTESYTVRVTSTTTTSNAYAGWSSQNNILQYSSSSKKYKHNIHNVSEELIAKFYKLYDIEVKNWTYNDGYLEETDELNGVETYGLIAEDVDAILPEAVTHKANGDIENYRDRHIMNAMLYLLQQQKKEIDILKEKVNALEQKEVA